MRRQGGVNRWIAHKQFQRHWAGAPVSDRPCGPRMCDSVARKRYERELAHASMRNMLDGGDGALGRGVMTDNGPAYRSGDFITMLRAGIRHRCTRPCSLWQKGKVECMNCTLA